MTISHIIVQHTGSRFKIKMTSLIQSAVANAKHTRTDFDLEDNLEQFSVVDPVRTDIPFQDVVKVGKYGLAEKGDPNTYITDLKLHPTPPVNIIAYVPTSPKVDTSTRSFLFAPRGNTIFTIPSGRWQPFE